MWPFRKRPERSNVLLFPTELPSGTAVETTTGEFFYIKGGKKYRVPSKRVWDSWNFNHVIKATPWAVAEIPAGGKLGFRESSLIRNIADGKYYVISENKRRHIKSPDVFTRLGYDKSKAIPASDAEVNMHTEGVALI